MPTISNDWMYHRAMSPKEFKTTMRALGLNTASCGRFLGVSERTAFRYKVGDAEMRTAEVLLLRACLAHNISLIVPGKPKKAPRRGT